jgi:hypothetical protein
MQSFSQAAGRADAEFAVPLRSARELRRYMEHAWGVRLGGRAACPHHVAPLAVAWDAYRATQPVIIVRGARGTGKTYMVAALGLTMATTLGASVTILGGSGEQSNRVHDHMRRMWLHPTAPIDMLLDEPTHRVTRLITGATITALLASSRSVRGPHPERLILDEADEIDVDLIDAALGQPQSRGPIRAGVLAVSTEHRTDGGMAYLRRLAQDRGWPVVEWCWRDVMWPHGWMRRDQLERVRATVPESVWRVEYEMGQVVSRDAAIDPEALAGVLDGPEIRDAGRAVEVEPPESSGQYACGVDWARSEHATVAVVIRCDVRPRRVVAYLRMRRQPWARQVERVAELATRYRARVWHDATGLGDVVHSLLAVPAVPIVWAPKTRERLITGYVRALETRALLLPRIDTLVSEHTQATWDDLWGRGHLPDSLAACAMAWYGAERMRGVGGIYV